MDGPEGYFYWRITLVRKMPDGSLKPYQVTCTGHSFGNCGYGYDGWSNSPMMAKMRRATAEERHDPNY
jgi:hypothetical protein